MQALRNMSMRRKQMFIIMLTTSAALLLACSAFVLYDVVHFRKELATRITGIAEVVANNCVGALDFNDARTAEETLGALRAQAEITAACIYNREGQVFAVFTRAGAPSFNPPRVQSARNNFFGDQLHLFRPIQHGGETIGTIYIASDLSELPRRAAHYASIVALVFAASLLVAFALSIRLQRVISDPILHLAKVAHSVAQDKNYSLRAEKQTEDELGRLIDGFNEMLGEIQQRDSALQSARDHLENRVEERTRELAGSLSLLNATLNSTADGIMAVELTGHIACYNEKFAAMWRVPEEMLKRGDNEQIVAYSATQVKDPEQFLKRIEQLRVHPEDEAFDLLELNDGRTFERVIRPQRVGNECVGCVLSFRDVTERRKAEAELESTHRELVQASRQAGMAEVATNVLHNVGNVLNSVNTSASVVMEQVRGSKVIGVGRMAALMEQNRADLIGFLSRENRAEQVMTYLKTLAEHLDAEHATTLHELGELSKNIEHIKEIVAMQQSYAKVSGVEEIHSAPALIEDALRIHATALGRHHVKIVRDFADVPNLLVDKHKVLQILVNLIGNAKYALNEANQDDRRLTLGLRANGGERVYISVADNGVGIAPENLVRIFSHGFTTKRDGHGFGLHSGFLAAKEMGGSLLVHSDGPGQGAVFTLELPINTRSRS